MLAMEKPKSDAPSSPGSWTFLTNHAHVLLDELTLFAHQKAASTLSEWAKGICHCTNNEHSPHSGNCTQT